MKRLPVPLLILLVAAAAVAAVAAASRGPLTEGPPDTAARPAETAVQTRPDIPSEVLPHSGAPIGLGAKLEWAGREAEKNRFDKGFWIGYHVKRLMRENSHIGTFDTDRKNRGLTIEEILSGKRISDRVETDGEVVRRTARAILDELEGSKKEAEKVWKDLGLFFLYGPGPSPVLEKTRMSNLDLSFDFEGLPLLWLGEAPAEESLAVIGKIYAGAGTDKLKKGLVAAAGVHGNAALAVPFLGKILDGKDSEGVRRDAAFWLGQQHDKAALGILVRTAKSDDARAVRKNAVFAISQADLPEAVDELIGLAKGSGGTEVKKEAVFWLGQIASKKASLALEEFATRDGDVKIQEQAVFALSQLPDNQGVDPLIKIAKTHPDPRIRKKAVFWLGECNDPRALETLIEIIKR